MNKDIEIKRIIIDYYKSDNNKIKSFKELRSVVSAYLYTYSELNLTEIAELLKVKAASTAQRDIKKIAGLIKTKQRLEVFDDIDSLMNKSVLGVDFDSRDIVKAFELGKKKQFTRAIFRDEVMSLMYSKNIEALQMQFKKIERVFVNL